MNLEEVILPREEAATVYVYRGIHGGHPALTAALSNGIIYASEPKANLTPGVHHAGGVSDQSQFTSWTYDFNVALRFAHSKYPKQPKGIVVRIRKTEPGPNDTWRWVRSVQDEEAEILLEGTRMDAEVIYDGSQDDDPSPA